MVDKIKPEHRSWNMSRIRSKNTSPEMRVRSFLHHHGYRFRLHDKSLPGSPDVVLKKHQTVIFIHGCYWHRHNGCKQGGYFPKDPSQGVEFWNNKFEKNVQRDKKNIMKIEATGWKVIVVWECETTSKDKLEVSLRPLLES